jgi:hypothetical protein
VVERRDQADGGLAAVVRVPARHAARFQATFPGARAVARP